MHRVGVLLLLGACVGGSEPPEASVQYGVQRHVMPFVDPTRPTAAFTDLPASDVRDLETWVWLPAGARASTRDRPVVLIAHGNSGHPEKFLLLAELLAQHGLVVAAPVFPATNRDGDSAGFALPDLANQPTDLDFVVFSLEREASDPDSVLYERLDVDRMVAVGHSLGGATVSGWTRWGEAPRDDLVGTVLMAPATFLNHVFGDGPHPDGPPVQLIHGQDDPLIPVEFSEAFYEDIDGPVAFAVLPDNAHSEPFEGETAGVFTSYRLIRGMADELLFDVGGAWAKAVDEAEAEGALTERKGL